VFIKTCIHISTANSLVKLFLLAGVICAATSASATSTLSSLLYLHKAWEI